MPSAPQVEFLSERVAQYVFQRLAIRIDLHRGHKHGGREIERSRDDRVDMRGIGNRDALLKRVH